MVVVGYRVGVHSISFVLGGNGQTTWVNGLGSPVPKFNLNYYQLFLR